MRTSTREEQVLISTETLTVTVKTATRTEMTSNGHYYRYRWEVMPRLASRTLAVEYDEEMSWLRKDKKCVPNVFNVTHRRDLLALRNVRTYPPYPTLVPNNK